MYYLKQEQECFIGYKTRGEAERFISAKARTASFLNGFKNEKFKTWVLGKYTCGFITYKTTATVVISYVFSLWIINEFLKGGWIHLINFIIIFSCCRKTSVKYPVRYEMENINTTRFVAAPSHSTYPAMRGYYIYKYWFVHVTQN